jgi:hypothetical protein
MEDEITELQRKVLALLTTVEGRAARYRLSEIRDRLAGTVAETREETSEPRTAPQ